MKSTENYNNCNPIKENPVGFEKTRKTLIANCDIKQDKKNMMIINEYEEDKNKEEDIAAFDDFDINYEYYLQAEKAAEAADSENKTCNLSV